MAYMTKTSAALLRFVFSLKMFHAYFLTILNGLNRSSTLLKVVRLYVRRGGYYPPAGHDEIMLNLCVGADAHISPTKIT